MAKISALIFALLLTAAVHAAEVAGTRFDERSKLGNSELTLNGAGLRAKFFIKVYTVGLYLPEKKTAAAEVLAAKGPKRLHIVSLRDLTAEQFADALVEGIHKNLTEAEVGPLKGRIEQFRTTILALKEAKKGAVVDLDWLPESGTRLTVDGQKRGEDIAGEDFYRAVLKIWLGDKPAQADLKDALLGK